MARKKVSQKDQVLQQMGEDPTPPKEKKQQPLYKIIGPKVPVSKAFGKAIETRKQAALMATELVREARNEAYRYYNHNQTKDAVARRSGSGDVRFRSGDSNENVVYSNVSTMVPAIYSKNPDIAFTTEQDEDKEFVAVLTKAVNAIIKLPPPLGISLKPRAKKAVLHAELANLGVLKLDWVDKDDSREEAQEEMERLYKELAEAKNSQQIKAIEGKMLALEAQMEWRDPSGFKLNNLIPSNIIIDPCAENEDGSDANWMLEECYLSTDFLNQRYTDGKTDEDGGKLIYHPTHKVKFDGEGARDDSLGLVIEALATGTDEGKDHTDEERLSYVYQNMTKCWYYWDKITRRIYLYADNDWSWPIWVWEDELKTTRFFPYHLMIFSPSTGGVESPGEVSYYLDQQDELNKINAELVRIRRLAFTIMVYNNTKIKPDDARKVANYLKTGKGLNILGIEVPEGQSIKDVLETIVPPSLNYESLFNKEPIYKAIERIGSVNETVRGGQFKTNTPARVAEQYANAAAIRITNRTDAIEDCIGELAWTIAELLVSKASKDYIKTLIGEKNMEHWESMSVAELNARCSVEVAAGSSEKPTSARKKEQAIEIAQAVGQFAQAAPGASLRIILKMFKKAFPDMDITDEDWEAIYQEIQQRTQAEQQSASGEEPTSEGQAIEDQLNQLPDEVKRQALEQIQAGADPREVIAPLIEEIQNAA